MTYQHRAGTAELWERIERLETELVQTRIQAEQYRRRYADLRQRVRYAKTTNLHPGNGDFGPDAFLAEASRAYDYAMHLPSPVHYNPALDPDHPRHLEYRLGDKRRLRLVS